MTKSITPEEARQITDIESYKRVTGAKRFKRDADEKQRGLTAEEALQERLQHALKPVAEPMSQTAGYIESIKQQGREQRRFRRSNKGEIVIRLRPTKDVDADYLENLPNEVILGGDNKFYGWLDELRKHPYNDNVPLIFQHILDLGVGEVATTIRTEQDVEDRDSST